MDKIKYEKGHFMGRNIKKITVKPGVHRYIPVNVSSDSKGNIHETVILDSSDNFIGFYLYQDCEDYLERNQA